jgi:hypothetical protein
MNIVITSHPRPEYLLIRSKGELISKDDLIKHSQMIYEEIMKHAAKKILVDDAETIFPLDLFSYYELVEFYLSNFPPDIRFLKIAIVISKEFEAVAGFWETVCVNRGLQYFAFTSFQDAHDWLVK